MSLLSRLAVQAAKAYGALSKGGVSASYLVVAGGGAGARRDGAGGGGGGAGGYLTSTATLSTLTTYTVTVGAGGATAGDTAYGGSGSNSVLSGTGLTTITSTGGGGGGATNSAGASGGSGGGGTHVSGAGGAGNTPSTTPSQGNNGGSSNGPGGGGGGAGAVGSNSSNPNGGNGGNGSASSISGSSVTYAGGGGGGSNGATGGTGGTGGGGAGSSSGTAGVAGTTNIGGGGGGSGYLGISPYTGAGGSGVVIISYTSATPKFVGGTLTTSGGNQIHTFTSSGSLSPLTPVTASYLVVAGGAGSATYGGGGAGGLLTSSTTLYSGATYVVTVGAGGAAGTDYVNGPSGGNSVLSGTGITTVTSTGGGGGAYPNTTGSNGGSGGGGGGGTSSGFAGGTGTSGQGNNGGRGLTDNVTYTAGGGGGGATAVGSNAAYQVGGVGGAGTASSITGSSVTYAGGGGGRSNVGTSGAGGSGGGGAASTAGAGTSGTINLGGGGGGGTGTGATGGSGTVIISYAGSQVFNGGLVTSSGGNTIHTFNATGALTPVTNNLNNSLRFRSSNSAYMTWLPVAAGNKKTWTLSFWMKAGDLSTDNQTMFSTSLANDRIGFQTASNSREMVIYLGAGVANLATSQVFRDPSAWYHIVVAVDTTQATAANRIKVYVNGNQVTSFVTSTYPTLNYDTGFGTSAYTQAIGRRQSTSNLYYDGYMTDINFIDGQALEPYYFGNNDAYGNWKPIKYTGMYGTNGFYLTFADASAATAAAIGKDSSGNGNNWTPSGISVTAGVTYDAMLDVPTNTSATVANYAVLNPLDKNFGNAGSIVDGNLGTTSQTASVPSTFYLSTGKWYFEASFSSITGASSLVEVGIRNGTSATGQIQGYKSDGNKDVETTATAYGSTYTTSDIIGCAFDLDAKSMTFYKNNVSQGSFTYTTADLYTPCLIARGTTTFTGTINFGQRPFSYTAPSGFVALNTYNLPTPTILQGNLYMDATLYTGTGTSQVIVNQGQFKPDFVWGKRRNGAADNILIDSIVGGNPPERYLSSNTTSGTTANADVITALNSNGFTVGTSGSLNGSSNTYVGWQWQAGQSSGSSNTSGTITSTVSVSTTAGFSVVTYTGNGSSSATVGHGLGVAPSWVIIKNRGAVSNWVVRHSSLSSIQNVTLNSTDAAYTVSSGTSNGGVGAVTSTTFGFISGTVGLISSNASAATYVAYCWAEIAGFSKFGSYTGNGSADGPFVFTGFRPKFILCKKTSDTSDWILNDTSRDTFNVTSKRLFPSDSGAESGTYDSYDILSNGFKMRNTNSLNISSASYIFMAFAENPFKNANAR